MTHLILPLSTYHIMTDFGPRIGVGNGGDFTTTTDDCADRAADFEGNPWRAFRMDFFRDENRLMRCYEVTAEISAIFARRANRGAGE
jgi:hypothetical protein